MLKSFSGVGVLTLAAWLVHWSAAFAQSSGPLVSVWLTTPDQLALIAPQGAVAFETDSGDAATTIDVNPQMTFQEIDGFGASFTDSSAWLVYSKLTPGVRNELMARLFDPVAGIGLSYLRQPMGTTDFALSNYTYDDVPAGQTDYALAHFSIDHDRAYILPLLKQARFINNQLRLMATPWSPPAWMKSSQSLIGGTLNDSSMAPLAAYFVKFVQAYQAEGIPVDRITIQNEPYYTPAGSPGMSMEWDQQATFVRDYLGPALANAGLTTGIAIWDHNWDHPSYPMNILADDGAAQYVSGSAFHCYAGTPDAMTNVHDFNPGKDLYFTECSGWTGQSWSDVLKYDLETLVIGATRNWARTVIKWNIALDTNQGPQNAGCPNCTGLVTIDQVSGNVSYNADYYTIGHASKFVMPGARRIASNTFGPGSIEDVAFRNPDGSIALIVLNSDTVPRTFKVRSRLQSFFYELPASAVATFTWHDATQWTNAPPIVALTAPINGASYVGPAALTLSATASDDDGYVTAVKFFAGASLIGSSARPPYTITWSAVPAGAYILTAVAFDNLGTSSTSPSVSVTVVPPGTRSTPFTGTPIAVPGTIEAANFDDGGEGVAYHDVTSGNAGGQYRATDVDIETSSDGGYDVGWIDAGEWLNYTVSVESAGSYTVQLRVSSPSGAFFHVGFNGPSEGQWKTVSVPATGGWQNWITVSVPVTLGAGTQQMTLLFDTGGMNFLQAIVGSAGILTPFTGTPIAVPGTIEAANFDNGGEGVAYHDVTLGNAGAQFRNTDVDIEVSSEGGYDVGWIDAGEWLNYTVSVGSAGSYTVQLRVSSPSGAFFHVGFNGPSEGQWKTVSVPATGGWQNWITVSVPVTLGAGTQQMTLLFDTGGMNFRQATIGP